MYKILVLFFTLIANFSFNSISTPDTKTHLLKNSENELFQNIYHDNSLPFPGDTFVPNKNYLITYYSHLKQNMPRNDLGTCGYTAISMFLSFYDTYWNDNFIPERYESQTTSIDSSDLYSSYVSAYESPGVWDTNISPRPSMNAIIAEINALGYTDPNSTEYKELLDQKIMEYIINQINEESFLGKLFEIALDNGSISPYYSDISHYYSNGTYLEGIGVGYDIMCNMLDDYIIQNDFLNGNVIRKSSKMNNNSESEKARIRSEIVNIVKSGRPVIVGGNGFNDTNGNGIHDAGETLRNHVAVAYDYDETNNVLYGNMGWSSGNSSHSNLDNYFNIYIADYYTFSISTIGKNLTNNYYFDDEEAFYSPGLNKLTSSSIIHPTDYNFADYYPTDYTTENTFTSHLLSDGFVFWTKRYRTGYIHDEYVVMSSIRRNINHASITYSFPNNYVSRIDVYLSHWRSLSYEWTYSSNCVAVLQTNELLLDLLANETNLPTDRTKPKMYTIFFDTPTTAFQFYCEYLLTATNDSNRGRICIGDLILYYD